MKMRLKRCIPTVARDTTVQAKIESGTLSGRDELCPELVMVRHFNGRPAKRKYNFSRLVFPSQVLPAGPAAHFAALLRCVSPR